jgi:hypothetical protein
VFIFFNHSIQNLKVYVGQDTNPQRQYCQYMKKSLTKMKKNVLKYSPFEQNFILKLLHVGHNKSNVIKLNPKYKW